VNGVEALYKPFDQADVAWKADKVLMEKRLERVVETLQILQPMRTEGHASLRKMMDQAKTSLSACLQGDVGETNSGRELRRRIQGLQVTT
jgi:proteasome component ECM29